MDKKYLKIIAFTLISIILIWIIWYANTVFLLAFSSILLAIFLNAVGNATKKITRLSYPWALALALIFILGFLTLTFWLYSPLIADQFTLLMNQLPQAVESLRANFSPFFGRDFLSQTHLQEEFSLSNQKILKQLLSAFSSTVGSLAGFVVFVIVGLYLAFDPHRYAVWLLKLIPSNHQKKVKGIMDTTGRSLRWWILGKLLSMMVVGILTFVGLSLMHVSLAFILGLLAALLTFIPYVGAILSSIPAILIGFTQSPLIALYVTILYVGIHIIDGYFITPSIEQRTASIPPALTIMFQLLMAALIGGIGLALATPLAVVSIALAHYSMPIKKISLNKSKEHEY